jgi:ABC-2 type transport system permease protein
MHLRRSLANIWRLGIKELWSLWRDPMMLVLIVFLFTVFVYSAATAMPDSLHNATLAIVDEDDSPLSRELVSAFYPPQFKQPALIARSQMDPGMDSGRYTFVLDIPPGFERDLLAGRHVELQLNVDATRMTQAFTGNTYIQQILALQIQEFARRHRGDAALPVDLALRARFNPQMDKIWFGSLMQIINDVTMLAVILTGAALIREREHGTVEHLLVMPVTPTEIMLSKVWSMGLVVLVAAAGSLALVVQGVLQVPMEGSVTLFLLGAALHLFATTSMGIYLATLARSMPQFGLLMILVMIPLLLLSGAITPRESMPAFVQAIMELAPTTHFVELGQAILYRGAGIDVVWQPFLALLAIGLALFGLSLARFRKTLSQMA